MTDNWPLQAFTDICPIGDDTFCAIAEKDCVLVMTSKMIIFFTVRCSDSYLKSRGAISRRLRRQVRNSWAVPSDTNPTAL